MLRKISVSIIWVFALLLFLPSQTNADTLVGNYSTGSSPAIASNAINQSFLEGNILYVVTANSGVSVVDTNGTSTFSDDTFLGTYSTFSTPAIASNISTRAFVNGNLLYIAGYGGVSVIDTNGTSTLSDDALLGIYSTSSTPAIANNIVKNIYLQSGILYVGAFGGGVSVIDTNGTSTFSDDTLVGVYDTSSSPAIASNSVEHVFMNGNILYVTSRNIGGVSVIDTNGTSTFSDDTLVGVYNTSSSPAIASNEPLSSHLFGTILYIAVSGSNVTVIETNGTSTLSDDTLLGTYSTSSTPAIGSNLITHVVRSGNLLYISSVITSSPGLNVIDTQGTATLADDVLVMTYNTSSTPAILNSDVRYTFLSGSLLYISTDGGVAVIDTTDPVVATDPVNVSLQVNSTISITSPADVTMGAITGTGKSDLATNSATWNIKTNNAAGYALSWQSSSADMTNLTADTIASYAPTSPGIPETWNVGTTNSAWGAHLSSNSTRFEAYNGQWGGIDDQSGVNYGTAAKWLNVDTTPYVIATSGSATTISGDDEIVIFGSEVGSSKIQPTGSYSVDVTMTATTL